MSADDARPWRGGSARNRFGERGIIVVFAILFVVLAGVAVLIAVIDKPAPLKSVCPKHRVCANPPRRIRVGNSVALSSSPALIEAQTFTSSVGYRVEYPTGSPTGDATSTGITIFPPNGAPKVDVHIDGAPNSSTTLQKMVEQSIAFLQGTIPDLHADGEPAREILSPALGGWAGVGGFFQGNFNSPTGFAGPADVAILAASDGQDTIAVVVIADRSETDTAFEYVDQNILDTLRFRSGAVQ
jgi:hypothetical protein